MNVSAIPYQFKFLVKIIQLKVIEIRSENENFTNRDIVTLSPNDYFIQSTFHYVKMN
jgi:hypothetical protein